MPSNERIEKLRVQFERGDEPFYYSPLTHLECREVFAEVDRLRAEMSELDRTVIEFLGADSRLRDRALQLENAMRDIEQIADAAIKGGGDGASTTD